MTTDRDDIASCPFCGGEAKLRRLVEKYPAEGEHPAGEYDAWFYINCDDCGIEVGDEYESGAIEAWNRRAPSASMGRVTDDRRIEAAAWGILLVRFYNPEPEMYASLDAFYSALRNTDHWHDALAEAKAALDAALDSPPDHGGGEGWVLVPREPTEAMINAWWNSEGPDAARFAAMLASLPTQESEDGR